ncbi:GFA family protein [Aurantiacibacter poecillastricola]|uniref:GFA family protein n=1 Tax=Aurantiacibacter poecillastricola TaxID=3064385 RepID=UPI00273FCA1B|nr:GFA family protein [Aurantiacibacter sp. 219JJ12-13]MDP5261754.1 GFA family protein [Aurantiacibacter sp. 219JJ12-13]
MRAHCQCGKLSADISDDAQAMTVLCHCTDCQRRSGSPFGVMAYYDAAAVTLVGEATEYERATDSGSTFTTGFCPNCGSTVYARPGKYPGMIGIAVGAFADPSFPAPVRSVYEQSRHPWVGLPDTMPRHPMGRDS